MKPFLCGMDPRAVSVMASGTAVAPSRVLLVCEAVPLLIATLKRRWPISTALIAALVYGVNYYNIRGLEGLRLEPRTDQAGFESPLGYDGYPSDGYPAGGPGLGWPASFPTGPGLPQPASTGYANGYSAPIAPGSGSDYGSRLGMPSVYPSTSPAGAGGVTALPPASSVAGIGGAAASNGALKGSVPLPAPRGWGDWRQMLSLGEKLGMLEQSQARPPLPTANQGAGKVGGAVAGMRDTIRIASFNVHGLGEAGRDDAAVAAILTRLLSQFDLIALQNIRSRRDDVLPNLVSSLNSGGRKYDFMIGPRVGRSEQREQFAFVFDTERIETDRFQLYTVEDPEDMLHREPLVGWFRAIGPTTADAFTFSLVNLHIDPDLVDRELQTLPSLLQAIASDGRGEDDIILAGDFHASAERLEFLAANGMRIALEGVASDTRGTHLLDNFAFGTASTTEYTGRSGAYDFLRQFNLSLEQAVAVSEHLPIWVEFSIIEGGRPGQVAGNALPVQRFQNDYH